MNYRISMNTTNPGCIIIMLEQSLYMNASYGTNGYEKKDLATLAVNRMIYEIIEACADGESIQDRVFIGVVGYGTKNPGVELILGDMLSEIGDNPKRVEKITRKISDGSGGLVEIEEDFPVWIEPVAEMDAPMDDAFQRTAQLAEEWCKTHPDSFPPVVINITSGKTTNELSTRIEAEKLLKISNNNGNVLLLNAYISDGLGDAIVFPSNKNSFNDSSADLLFDISSTLPDILIQEAQYLWETVEIGAKGMIYNTDAALLLRLFDFGATDCARY